MTTYSETPSRPLEDPVSNVLKWILLAVAVGSFALFAWATVLTYERAAPQPDGSDHPYPWQDHPVDHVMATTSLRDDDKLAILGGNAAKVFGMKV